MTKRRILSVAFAVLGVYFIASVVRTVSPVVILRVISPEIWGSIPDALRALWPLLAYAAPLTVMGALLIVFGDRFARTITREDPMIGMDLTVGWEEPALRIAFALSGLFLLADAAATMARVGTSIFIAATTDLGEQMLREEWAYVIGILAKGGFGVYLLVGGPGLRQFILRGMQRRVVPAGPLDQTRPIKVLDAEPPAADKHDAGRRSDRQ